MPNDGAIVRRPPKEERGRGLLWYALMTVCAGVALYALISLGAQFARTLETRRENAALQALHAEAAPTFPGAGVRFEILSEIDPEPEATPQTPNAAQRVASMVAPPILPALSPIFARNNDTVGWLKISDLLDLPVVQRDNEYYITHSFAKRKSASGALFMDEANTIRSKDPIYIIYGHNMRDGTMFGRLSRYEQPAFYKKHPILEFDTLYERGFYVVFAAFNFSTDSADTLYFPLYGAQALATSEAREAYLARVVRRSPIKPKIEVTGEDDLLALVTCSYDYDDARFVVFARRLREGESVSALKEAASSVQ